MAVKQVLLAPPRREKVLRGATLLADAIRITIGPKSKSVLVPKKWGVPLVCNAFDARFTSCTRSSWSSAAALYDD